MAKKRDAKEEVKIVAILPDVKRKLEEFRKDFPDIKQVHWLSDIIYRAIQDERAVRSMQQKG